jgi:DNA-binding CsgD family transcriptional regulator
MSGSRFEALEDLPVNVAVLDATGTIVGVNERWKQFGRSNGFSAPDFGIGLNYLGVCERAFGATSKLVQSLKALLSGDLSALTHAYPCHSPTERRWFILIGLPLATDRPSGAAILHINVSEMIADYDPADRSIQDTEPLAFRSERGGTVLTPELLTATLEQSLEKVLSSVLARKADPITAGAPGPSPTDDNEAYERVQRLLSKRQMQVLGLIGQGKTNLEIAEALSTSPNTVKLHVSGILKRLHLSSRTQAALLAAKLTRKLP